jgi:hypothetical protein
MIIDSILYQVQVKIARRWTRDSEHLEFRTASERREAIKNLIAIGELRHATEIRIKPIVMKAIQEAA